MKKVTIIFLLILILVGCENKKEENKDEYISIKKHLLEEKEYTKGEDLPVDITVKIDREDEEKVKYKVILNHPKENMKEIKILVINNYYNEEVFPSVGIFDDPKNLSTTEQDSSIELDSILKTTKNISKINLELKIWMEYINELGEKKEIYYKTTQ